MAALHTDDRIVESASTRHRDYILTDYAPRCDPVGRLHPACILRHALRATRQLDALWPVIEALKQHLGPEQTVWGLKYTPSGLSVELYLYNNANNPPGHPMALSELSRVLAPHLALDAGKASALPYFMASFELDAAQLAARTSSGFCIYVGTGDKSRTPGAFSYRVSADGLAMENHYAFYYAERPQEMRDLHARVALSPRAGGEPWRATLVPEYLLECRTVCFAVKPRHDGLYYSRVSSEQLCAFLERHLPGPVLDALCEEPDAFAHLRWDVGFDFAAIPGDGTPPSLTKIGIYGVV